MANLEIKGKSIEMETNSYSSPSYFVEIVFNTPKTENSEHCKSLKIRLEGNSRSDMTFSEIESQINEHLEENREDLEISEFLRIEVFEKETIKRRPFDNYEF